MCTSNHYICNFLLSPQYFFNSIRHYSAHKLSPHTTHVTRITCKHFQRTFFKQTWELFLRVLLGLRRITVSTIRAFRRHSNRLFNAKHFLRARYTKWRRLFQINIYFQHIFRNKSKVMKVLILGGVENGHSFTFPPCFVLQTNFRPLDGFSINSWESIGSFREKVFFFHLAENNIFGHFNLKEVKTVSTFWVWSSLVVWYILEFNSTQTTEQAYVTACENINNNKGTWTLNSFFNKFCNKSCTR